MLAGNLVVWKSKKQDVVARFSAEAQYRAVAKATTELVWIKILLDELGFAVSGPMKLWCDNKAAIHIAHNPVFHERTKHIELGCHYIRDKVKEKIISLEYINSEVQIADIMTKALRNFWQQELRSKLCLTDVPSELDEECCLLSSTYMS